MKCDVKFKSVKHSEALSQYVMDRLDKLSRFEIKPLRAHITFSAVKHNKTAEIYVNGLNGVFRARASKESFHEAVDAVLKKLERQMLKEKAKVKDHRHYNRSAEAQLEELARLEQMSWPKAS